MAQLRALVRRRNKMAEENKQKTEMKENKEIESKLKEEKKDENITEATDSKIEEQNIEKKDSEKSKETKKDSEKPKETKKEPKKDIKLIVKKYEAVARGRNLPVSKKQSVYICSFVKHKPIDKALSDLELVIKKKKAVPFKGEIPHRKGMSRPGRYPVKAAGLFIDILKGLKGNIIVNGLELEKTRICMASATWAARPMRSGGRQAKRTNVLLKAKEFSGGKK